MTSNERTTTEQFRAEINLAERSFHVLMERIALKRMPADALPTGDVYDLLDAAGEHLEIEALEKNGHNVRKRRMKNAAIALTAAIDRLATWPIEARLEVFSFLVGTMRRIGLELVADHLLQALQLTDVQDSVEAVEDVAEGGVEEISEEIEAPVPDPSVSAAGRVLAIVESGAWNPQLEDLLRQLREICAEKSDDLDLRETLERGIVFNAVKGRERLLLEERRRLAGEEPLPEDLDEVLAEIPDDIVGSELARLGLHLVLADVVAADVVPDDTPPEITVAATLVAMRRQDEPGKKPNIDSIGVWARSNPLKLDVLSDEIAPVFEWKPPEYDGSLEERHGTRWRVTSQLYQYLPTRWTPGPHEKRPPYSASAAEARLEELRDVAWLMIDQIEPVRFVSEAFHFGNGAPESMDLDIAHRILELWNDQSLISATDDLGRAYLEDEWHHEIPGDAADHENAVALPSLKAPDGEPLMLSTVVFDVMDGARKEIVKHLDRAESFRRQPSGEADRWVWLGPSKGSSKTVADITLGVNHLTVETQSLARASKANARLVEELGDKIVLKDIRTREPTEDMLAGIDVEVVGEEGYEPPSEDQKRVVHGVLERHYRGWLDKALPSLGDASPRDAVDDPERRPEVISLLIEAEERTRASSWPMNQFDFDFLWEELGLSRDETD